MKPFPISRRQSLHLTNLSWNDLQLQTVTDDIVDACCLTQVHCEAGSKKSQKWVLIFYMYMQPHTFPCCLIFSNWFLCPDNLLCLPYSELCNTFLVVNSATMFSCSCASKNIRRKLAMNRKKTHLNDICTTAPTNNFCHRSDTWKSV